MINEFDEALEKIGSFYEEGKDCLNFFIMDLSAEEKEKAYRLYDILKELRDISALAYKKLNTTNNN